MVALAQDRPWSNVRAHQGGRDDELVRLAPLIPKQKRGNQGLHAELDLVFWTSIGFNPGDFVTRGNRPEARLGYPA
jgi:hypothetical protein